ncbi:hypothetical protein M758_3G021500 [Ceratodon purpureus]|nr:hypothetical protein M758_3G021500 [Ceratodon purpureus]
MSIYQWKSFLLSILLVSVIHKYPCPGLTRFGTCWSVGSCNDKCLFSTLFQFKQ